MSDSYNDMISHALAVLAENVGPDLEGRLREAYGPDWKARLQSGFRDQRRFERADGKIDWDAHLILTAMWDHWKILLRGKLGHIERSLVSELREFRNQWAHQKTLTFDDAYRVLDSIERLLRAMLHSHSADEIAQMKRDLLKESYSPQSSAAEIAKVAEDRFTPLQTVWITAICCLFILIQIYLSWSTQGWFMMLVVVFAFSLLIVKRILPLMRKPAV